MLPTIRARYRHFHCIGCLFFGTLLCALFVALPVAGTAATPSSLRPGSVSCTAAWQDAGAMITSREQHTATLLADSTVLVVGGTDLKHGIEPLASAEIYDPATNRWRATGSLHAGRYYHTATLLPSGQ